MSDNTINILRKLTDSGKISREAVLALTGIDVNEDKDLRTAVELLHTQLCSKVHSDIPATANYDPDVCDFLIEDGHVEPWLQKDHLVWLETARELATLYRVNSNELLAAVGKVTKIYSFIMEAGVQDGIGKHLIYLLLGPPDISLATLLQQTFDQADDSELSDAEQAYTQQTPSESLCFQRLLHRAKTRLATTQDTRPSQDLQEGNSQP